MGLEFPMVDFQATAGGFWIAAVAVFHVFIAHFAVGAGLFLWLCEWKAHRENDPAVFDYTKRHAGIFLFVTMVPGATSGVGIWFVISFLTPAATYLLIRTFVFAFAAEWAFFIGEIITLFILYYRYDAMKRREHMRIVFLYFVFAWFSLFIINGIVAFMLTPGKWPATGQFWDAFFNPSFYPSLFFRTGLSILIAGAFGFTTAAFSKDSGLRGKMTRVSAGFIIAGAALAAVFAGSYYRALPVALRTFVSSGSPEISAVLPLFFAALALSVGLAAALSFGGTAGILRTGAVVLMAAAFTGIGSFEWMREAARRPYLVYGVLYSNGVFEKQLPELKQAGILSGAPWARHKKITGENQTEAGADLLSALCLPCHSVGGPMSDILPLTAPFPRLGLEAVISGMETVSPYMPPFPGTAAEREALAAYIASELHGRKPLAATSVSPLPVEIPPFDPTQAEYLLLPWSGSGLRIIAENARYLTFSQKSPDLHAVLIRRGPLPERVTEGVTIRREAVNAAGDSIHLPAVNYGYDNGRLRFSAQAAKTVPVETGGVYNPYPLYTLTAEDGTQKAMLVSTKFTAPATTEIGCIDCHTGRLEGGRAGLSDEACRHILSVHDKRSGTNLLRRAAEQQIECRSCHLIESGSDSPLSFPAAIHGFHAPLLSNRAQDACHACHPNTPAMTTGSLRGIHGKVMLSCVNCHGSLEDHALSLLAAEAKAGKAAAHRLIRRLPSAPENRIAPRAPFVNEPDCLHCHIDFQMPQTDTVSMDQRTDGRAELFHMRTDDAGIACAACHGTPHALYPATNIFQNNRENIPPVQYQKMPFPIAANRNCKVCHTIDMETEIHHPNSLAEFRNDW